MVFRLRFLLVPPLSLAKSIGSGETVRMRSLTWTFVVHMLLRLFPMTPLICKMRASIFFFFLRKFYINIKLCIRGAVSQGLTYKIFFTMLPFREQFLDFAQGKQMPLVRKRTFGHLLQTIEQFDQSFHLADFGYPRTQNFFHADNVDWSDCVLNALLIRLHACASLLWHLLGLFTFKFSLGAHVRGMFSHLAAEMNSL